MGIKKGDEVISASHFENIIVNGVAMGNESNGWVTIRWNNWLTEAVKVTSLRKLTKLEKALK